MGRFNLDDYETVEERIKRFWESNKSGSVTTELVTSPENLDEVVVFAKVVREDGCYATGLAHEVRGDGPVNKTSHIENCETSAIGRALAALGYFGNKKVSREEMAKVERSEKKSPAEMVKKVFTDVESSPFAKLVKYVNEAQPENQVEIMSKARELKGDDDALEAYYQSLVAST